MNIIKKQSAGEQSSNINNTYCCNEVCKILQNIGVPNDIEWRSTINFLRTIGENRKYSNEQKKKLQDILQKFIHENKNNNYNNKKLQEIKSQIDNIINNNTSIFLSYLKDLEKSYLKINELLSNVINEYDKIIIDKNITSNEEIEDIKKIQNNTNFYNKKIQTEINNNININNSNFQDIIKEMFNNFALNTNNLIKKMEDDIKKLEQKHENTDKWKNIAENLETLASTDCLTGLLNKRIFLNYIEEITINIFNFLNKIIFKEIIDFYCCNEKSEIYQSFINFSDQIYHHQKIKTTEEENINSNKNTQKWIEFIKNIFLLNNNIADDLHSVAIIMIDIDNFKKINDNYGHITGDEVLKFISNFIAKNISKNSKIFRYGGEEIIIIYKNTDIHMILDEMENIRIKIANYPFKVRYKLFQNNNENEKQSNILKITVSIGVFCINNINIIEIIKNTNYFEIINKYFTNIIKNNIFNINNIKNLKKTEKTNFSNYLLNNIIANFPNNSPNNSETQTQSELSSKSSKELEYQSEYQFAMQSFIYKIIDIADALMYKSKKAGKNCIHSY